MSNNRKIVVASGYFDPIHIGHIEYLEQSKKLGDVLIVIVNNDHQASLKKGKPFMPASSRVKVVRALKCVDIVIESVDTDKSVCKTLAALHPDIFTNGGDQLNDCIPEARVCREMGILMIDRLGDKIDSSSKLIEQAKQIKNYKLI
jgi:rfaE bifunctional protein nucleotidyltransferase chain/domain